jgi:hypothetical protein
LMQRTPRPPEEPPETKPIIPPPDYLPE